MSAGTPVLINGEAQDYVSIQDRGFQYGDGVFETIAVCAGRPALWEHHLARLQEGCSRLGIEAPEEDVLRIEAERLCATSMARAVLKLIITRGQSVRGYAARNAGPPTRVLELRPWPDYPAGSAQRGVDVRICETRISRNPRLAGIKHLNRLEQVLARSEWDTEFAEGLMLDEHGHIIEGTATNVFLVSQGTLLTPDLAQSGVAGVMRETVLGYAAAASIPCKITQINRPMLDTAEEVFLTNSLIGIWPVRRVESRSYGPGDTTRQLQQGIKGTHCFDEAL
ncbi:MAG: aminodeoxychorismate lyase [Acidiferrobacterales bacterium]